MRVSLPEPCGVAATVPQGASELCQADTSAVATVPKTKELMKRYVAKRENRFPSDLEAASVRAALLSARHNGTACMYSHKR